MTTTPPTEVEFPLCYFGVVEWENALLARYCSRDLVSSSTDRFRMKSLEVTAIRCFKEKKLPEHEYLVAEVYDPSLRRNRYLQFERFSGDFPGSSPSIQDDSHSIPSTPSQSSLVFKKSSAIDYVHAIAAWPTGDICIVDLTCQDCQMIILDLAIVAKVVHDNSVEYQALKRQCFWFAGVIVSVLRKSFPQIKVSNNASSLEPDSEMEFSFEKGGRYRCIPIYSERPELITEIHDAFKTHRDQIYSSITEAAQYVEQKLDADKRVYKDLQDAKRRADGAERRAIEAEKEKEGAERRAIEAEKEIAALKQRMQDIEAANVRVTSSATASV